MSTDNFEQHNDTQGLSAKEFMASQLFARTFADGMGLVEEAAAYLDGDGRKGFKRSSACRRPGLCRRKHAPDHAADAGGLLAAGSARR